MVREKQTTEQLKIAIHNASQEAVGYQEKNGEINTESSSEIKELVDIKKYI